MQSSLATPELATTIRLRIAAASVLRLDAATIDGWRRQPLIVGTEKLPVSMLRHAEDQTLAALKAVLDARTQLGGEDASFTDWGVIAAPNFYGRMSVALSLQRFHQEGAWGVSPHLIPHQSLHAVSGTISQVLKIHGPNFGVGGGPNSASDAILLAATMLFDESLPGLWLVLSGHADEWIPAQDGNQPAAPECIAIALALTAASSATGGLHLAIGGLPENGTPHALALLPTLEIGPLADELTQVPGQSFAKWRVGAGHWVEIEMLLADAEAQS